MALGVVALCAIGITACPKTVPPAQDAGSTTTSGPPGVDTEADRETAEAAALALDDLPGNGWHKSTTATTAKKSSTNVGSSFDCPELGDEITEIEKKAASFAAPVYERASPYTEVRNTIMVTASEDEATVDIEANKRPETRDCLERGLAHDVAREGADFDVQVNEWKIPKLGDARVGYEILLTTESNGQPFEAHIGVALVKVGRTLTTVMATFTEPLGEDAQEIVRASVDKVKATR